MSKSIIIILNGYPESGKDELCVISSYKYDIINYSTVDTVKNLATDMGWNGNKTPKNRDMLSALKDFYVKWFDGTFKEMTTIIDNEVGDIYDFIFFHIREPEEMDRVNNYCKLNDVVCFNILVQRDSKCYTDHNNHADSNVCEGKYNIIISNNGTLKEFGEKVMSMLSDMRSTKIQGLTNLVLKY